MTINYHAVATDRRTNPPPAGDIFGPAVSDPSPPLSLDEEQSYEGHLP